MKAEGLVKQDHILEAAVKRFSHFGVQKTTLAEIAADLSISKPSLFYYFTDKNALITAVANKILNEFLDNLEMELKASASVEEGLLKLIEIKRKHFKKYFLLAIQSDGVEVSNLPPELLQVYQQSRERITVLLANLIAEGVRNGELKSVNAESTSRILLYTLSAFEHYMKKKKFIPDSNEFDDLFDKQSEILSIMLNGLKAINN